MKNKIDLTINQVEAIELIDKNLQIIACAGSGKTEVITRRIAYILETTDTDPKNIVAFTFTNKASESMKQRIDNILDSDFNTEDMFIGTIHAFCLNSLQNYCVEYSNLKVLDAVKTHLFVKRYWNDCGFSELKELSINNKYDIKLFLDCIDKLVDDYSNKDKWTEQQHKIFDKYQTCLKQHNYIDFSILILETIKNIQENDVFLSYVRSIKYLIVDEYQDIDDLQEKLIQLFVENGANICIVGDDDQTIYQFRGSNAENMISFQERYPNVSVVHLDNNFRCNTEIAEMANYVISKNIKRLNKKMIANKLSSVVEPVFIQTYKSEIEQYIEIAESIKLLHEQNVPYREMAILVRKGKFIHTIGNILNNNNIPIQTQNIEEYLEGIYFLKFYETIEKISEMNKATFFAIWEELVDKEKLNDSFEFLRTYWKKKIGTLKNFITGLAEKLDFFITNEEEIEVRQKQYDCMIRILDDYDEIFGDYQLSYRIKSVLNFIKYEASDEYKYVNFGLNEENLDAVQVMTIHKAKGLEFHSVFIPNLKDGTFPASNMGGRKYWHILGEPFAEKREKYKTDLEDERKLFYVGITRAKEKLFLLSNISDKESSIFLKEASEGTDAKTN